MLLKSVTSVDQPLVDELSRDSDPLVREATVPALQRLGALRDIERVNQLLRDKNPSVRTAVLRELSQHPDSRAIEALIEYVEQETDEDLLVYATKALGQMGTRNDADSALGSWLAMQVGEFARRHWTRSRRCWKTVRLALVMVCRMWRKPEVATEIAHRGTRWFERCRRVRCQTCD